MELMDSLWLSLEHSSAASTVYAITVSLSNTGTSAVTIDGYELKATHLKVVHTSTLSVPYCLAFEITGFTDS
jgi:hypothetical protein